MSIQAVLNQSYGLGGECPLVAGAGGYRISFDMKFKALPSTLTEHAGVYLGKTSDDVYRSGTANTSGGYHVVIRANGQMQLNRHTAGYAAVGDDCASGFAVGAISLSVSIRITRGCVL
ncbi:hypothetical protein NRF20_07570 [Streptomyces sp. R-74717]|uniref:hypothetical protein n=1 Tax=Streptomyces TaxID=1883 RepID=UPI0037892A2B